ncbi:ImmA/IrrE family metallo-endopeptidase [Actinomadura welshii]|uniref:ImmA/IrrE family metallo-endopeptidase n=1 Tax=Actinomadura welshii TaxID=3103817 RepID=UPI001377BDD8|nr:ImmA/IrrE family metallo-endopeptidase [Actinomadura madurae]
MAGSYWPDPPPPTLLVARSASYRRRGFTALHELGHHLQQTDIDLGQRTYQVDDPDLFQEEACDAFAAQVLLPDDQLHGRIDSRGPTAEDVVDLFHRSAASREACCVWAARHLTGAGTVVLLDESGTVLFAAPRSFIPPARGTSQAGTPLIEAAIRTRGTTTRDATYVVYRNGSIGPHCYGQAAWCGDRYLIAILAIDNAAWRSFAPPRPDTGQSSYGTLWSCETCNTDFAVNESRCDRCAEPRCPNGHCACTAIRAAKERVCTSCFLSLPPSRFDDGSRTCRDCA